VSGLGVCRMTARGWFALALLLPLLSCVSGSYIRFRADEPLSAEAIERLQPGVTTLEDGLRSLGAPTHVFEYRDSGMALLWSWLDTEDWGVSVSAPISDQVSASFDMDQTDDRRQGCMLWFGPDLVLERWRLGRIGELVATRARPSAVE